MGKNFLPIIYHGLFFTQSNENIIDMGVVNQAEAIEAFGAHRATKFMP